MRTIAKTIATCRTDGWAYALGCLWRFLATGCALRGSETLFFRRGAAGVPVGIRAVDRLEFVRVSDASSLAEHPHPKLACRPYREWFAAGSVCFLGLVQRKVVSYCWAHPGCYSLGRIGRFGLREGEWWIGPVYVDKRYRGRGINTAQIRYALQELSGAGEKVFFTATNAANHASMKSFVKCGFVVIGRCRLRTLLKWPVRRTVCEWNDQGLMTKSLQ